ncbi:hypothetical protein PENSPDRAFT_736537 [Peniophora sp. CONT]|nr:hypothetical protein PENSPDRAFT_736537 [Peniophora sp. CONT]
MIVPRTLRRRLYRTGRAGLEREETPPNCTVENGQVKYRIALPGGVYRMARGERVPNLLTLPNLHPRRRTAGKRPPSLSELAARLNAGVPPSRSRATWRYPGFIMTIRATYRNPEGAMHWLTACTEAGEYKAGALIIASWNFGRWNKGTANSSSELGDGIRLGDSVRAQAVRLHFIASSHATYYLSRLLDSGFPHNLVYQYHSPYLTPSPYALLPHSRRRTIVSFLPTVNATGERVYPAPNNMSSFQKHLQFPLLLLHWLKPVSTSESK